MKKKNHEETRSDLTAYFKTLSQTMLISQTDVELLNV